MSVIKTVKDIDFRKFDFLDFGASKAESLEYAKKHLFGKRGLGIDLDPGRVEAMNKIGYDCIVGDLTNLEVPDNCVEFIKMAHILEHLPSLKDVEKVINIATRAAAGFLVITGPYFDEDKYLASKGFKLHWSDYSEHTCHLTATQLVQILNRVELEAYELYLRGPMTSSNNHHILPIKTPSGAHHYDQKLHPAKRAVEFNRVVWTDFVCYVRLGPVKNWQQITKAYKNQVPYIFKDKKGAHQVPDTMLPKLAELAVMSDEQYLRLSSMKKKEKQTWDELTKLKRMMNELQSSRAHKTARQLQRAAFAVKNPKAAIKKIRS
jgi:hypothetical protein